MTPSRTRRGAVLREGRSIGSLVTRVAFVCLLPILDDIWVFGSDDETLYKLIKGQIPQQMMPKTGAGIPDEQVWKMLAYVRSFYKGDPKLINWGLTPSPSASPSPSPPPSAVKPPKR
jgi:hypothetical protein